MRNKLFRTEFQAEKAATSISHKDMVMLIGSCFAENIGEKLSAYKFNTCLNPFGILFNPASIAQSLDILSNNSFVFKENDLHFYNDEWCSFFHHGKFSNTDLSQCLHTINEALFLTRKYLQQTDYLILTLGSSIIYRYHGNVVANCHKLPQKEFEKTMLSIDEIISVLLKSIVRIREFNPKIKIIFTISPVRYIKDNMVENKLSKANLIIAVHQLLEKLDNSYYFPAYEIMMDDLRDYRFYSSDMIHPSDVAIDYIWELFSKTFFDKQTWDINEMIHEILLAKNHRLKNPFSQESKKFKTKQIEKIHQIKELYPHISIKEELNYFSQDKNNQQTI